MPDLDDFIVFRMTSSDSGSGSGSGNSGGGCSGGCLPWVLGAMAILWFIGEVAG